MNRTVRWIASSLAVVALAVTLLMLGRVDSSSERDGESLRGDSALLDAIGSIEPVAGTSIEPIAGTREVMTGPAQAASSGDPRDEDRRPAPLRVLVRSQVGEPVQGAEVLVYPQASPWWSAGITQGDGTLKIERERLGPAPMRMVALSLGCSPAARLVPSDALEVTLVLAPANALAGQVTLQGLPLAMAGLRVVAEDSGAPALERRRFVDPKDPELDLLSAPTDEAGRFTIPGARADRAYRVYAGGHGYYTRLPAPSGFGDRRDSLEAPVEKIYGAVVRFVDETGRDAEFGDAARRGAWWRSVQLEDGSDDSHPIVPTLPHLGLSGIDEFLLTALPDSWGLTIVGVGVHAPRLSRRTDTGRPPGYEQYSVSYELLPVEAGLAHVTVALRRATEGFGSLRVRFVDATTGRDVPPWLAPVPGMLHLFTGAADPAAAAYDRRDGSLSMHVLERDGTLPVLEGIPHGTYSVSYDQYLGPYAHPKAGSPGKTVVIGPEEEVLALPVAELGAIRLHLSHPDGTPYEGQVMASLRQLSDSARGSARQRRGPTVTLPKPPHVMNGVPSGAWAVNIRIPAPIEREVEVESGQMAQLFVELERR